MKPTDQTTHTEVPDAVDAIPKTPWRMVVKALVLFSKLPLSWQIFVAVIGFAGAIVSGVYLGNILFTNQNNLARMLNAQMVSTAYPHRGVTALLVAKLGGDAQLADDEKTNLKKAVKELKDSIEDLSKAATEKFKPDEAYSHLKLKVIDKYTPDNRPEAQDQDHTWTRAVIEEEIETKKAFLMVPGISLRQSQVGEEVLGDSWQKSDQPDKTANLDKTARPDKTAMPDDCAKPDKTHKPGQTAKPDKLKCLFHHNPEIVFDFYVAKQIDEKLKQFRNLSPQIVQAYFISESGVILLRAFPKSQDYKYTFPNNTLFMDRLYFWGAITPLEFIHEQSNSGPLDYKTDPYIDLGGNGVVRTFSSRVELPNYRNGVICVDVMLPDTETEIEERLKALGAQVEVAQYTEGKQSLDMPAGEDKFNWVNSQFAPGKAKSRILGAIAFESDLTDNKNDDVIRFTVPIKKDITGGTTVTKVLLVTFNFWWRRLWIWVAGGGFLLGIALVVFVTGNLFVHLRRHEEEMKAVLKKMSKVMYEAATPFAWLNEKNEFQQVNVSFLQVVGCKTEHELKMHAPTFRDLVSADTTPVYDRMLEEGALGNPTPKYQIKIVKLNDEEISVWAHGESIPVPTLGRPRPPHRFGVFLPSGQHDDGWEREG